MIKVAIVACITLILITVILGTIGVLSINEMEEHCLSNNGIIIRTETHGYKCFDSKLLKFL